jgi:hypothetical protein
MPRERFQRVWRSLAADLKLPKFEADGNRYQYSWPPPQPNLALQIAAIRPDPFIISEAAKGSQFING